MGMIRTIISQRQAAWLYKMIAKERHAQGKRILRHEGKAFYEGCEVGTWIYGERDYNDQYERMIFMLNVAFIREYMQADPVALEIVARQIGD